MASAEDEVVPATAMLFAVMNKKGERLGAQHQFVDQLILLRHGERQDHAARAWRGSAHLPPFDPPLSPDGRRQCLETALRYRALRCAKAIEERATGLISFILTSPFQRCLETALIVNLVAFDGALAIFVDPQLSDWQQSRIYRATPEIAGYYTPRVRPRRGSRAGSALPELRFCPHRDALRTSLTPFFQSLLTAATATPTSSSAGHADRDGPLIAADEAQHWLTCLQQWLTRHYSLPVWTSPSTVTFIHDTMTTPMPPTGTTVARQRTARRPDADSKAQASETADSDALAPRLAHCGVAFAESRNELRARCLQFLQTHFAGDDTAALSVVPRLILAAVQRERTAHLPRYFATNKELPAAQRTAAVTRDLLPPMHTLVVTHADVIATLLAICCPRHHASGAGFSVPYCSLTVLTRNNRYYHAVEPCGRDGGPGGQPRRHAGRLRNGCKTLRVSPASQRTAIASCASGSPSDVRDEWQAVKVGATDLLRTRIVIQFNK